MTATVMRLFNKAALQDPVVVAREVDFMIHSIFSEMFLGAGLEQGVELLKSFLGAVAADVLKELTYATT